MKVFNTKRGPSHTGEAPKRPSRAGGALPSRGVAPAVLSALAGLAFGFGMVPGVPPPPAAAGPRGALVVDFCVWWSSGAASAPWGPHSDRGRESVESAGRARSRVGSAD